MAVLIMVSLSLIGIPICFLKWRERGGSHRQTINVINRPVGLFQLPQWFSNFSVHQNHLESLLKHELFSPTCPLHPLKPHHTQSLIQ